MHQSQAADARFPQCQLDIQLAIGFVIAAQCGGTIAETDLESDQRLRMDGQDWKRACV